MQESFIWLGFNPFYFRTDTNSSCRYKKKDISPSSLPEIPRILWFLPPCSVHHRDVVHMYIAWSFVSPSRPRFRAGCYGNTLLSFCSASSNSVPDFHSSHLILMMRPFSFYPMSLRAFWDFRTTLKRRSFVSETTSCPILKKTLLHLIFSYLIFLDKSKFSGSTGNQGFFICHHCISNIIVFVISLYL